MILTTIVIIATTIMFPIVLTSMFNYQVSVQAQSIPSHSVLLRFLPSSTFFHTDHNANVKLEMVHNRIKTLKTPHIGKLGNIFLLLLQRKKGTGRTSMALTLSQGWRTFATLDALDCNTQNP